jgi:hypothetical protein
MDGLLLADLCKREVSWVRHRDRHRCSSDVKSVGLRWLGYSRTQETRQCILVQAVGALRLAVSSSSYSGAPKSEGYNEREREFGKRSLGAIQRLVSDEVSSPTSKGNAPLFLSCQGRNTLLFLSVALTELGLLSPLSMVAELALIS